MALSHRLSCDEQIASGPIEVRNADVWILYAPSGIEGTNTIVLTDTVPTCVAASWALFIRVWRVHGAMIAKTATQTAIATSMMTAVSWLSVSVTSLTALVCM